MAPSTAPAPQPMVAPTSHRVLLLIDVQHNMLDEPPRGVPAASEIRGNILCILTAARTSPTPPLIIHIRNTGDPGDVDDFQSPGWHLVFEPLEGEPVIDKKKNNAFTETNLGELIATDAEIIIAGMQSDFCIRATCSAALGRGNEVFMIRHAHATYDRIEAWNGGSITPANVIERDVEAELEEAGVIMLDMDHVSGIFNNRDS